MKSKEKILKILSHEYLLVKICVKNDLLETAKTHLECMFKLMKKNKIQIKPFHIRDFLLNRAWTAKDATILTGNKNYYERFFLENGDFIQILRSKKSNLILATHHNITYQRNVIFYLEIIIFELILGIFDEHLSFKGFLFHFFSAKNTLRKLLRLNKKIEEDE